MNKSSKSSSQSSSSKRRIVLIALVVVGVLCVGWAGVYALQSSKDNDQKKTSDASGINYDPPTKQEQQAGNDQKQQNEDKQAAIEEAQKTPSGSASVVITDAAYYKYDGDSVQVRAYISNIYEDGGTCTATLTQGGQTVTQSSTGFKNVSTTQCGAIDIPRAQFPQAGDWQLVVSYSSSTASGKTAPQVVNIKS